MYVIVPNALTGLQEIFNELTELRSELYYLQEHLVDVKLPKFQFEYTAILDGILREVSELPLTVIMGIFFYNRKCLKQLVSRPSTYKEPTARKACSLPSGG